MYHRWFGHPVFALKEQSVDRLLAEIRYPLQGVATNNATWTEQLTLALGALKDNLEGYIVLRRDQIRSLPDAKKMSGDRAAYAEFSLMEREIRTLVQRAVQDQPADVLAFHRIVAEGALADIVVKRIQHLTERHIALAVTTQGYAALRRQR